MEMAPHISILINGEGMKDNKYYRKLDSLSSEELNDFDGEVLFDRSGIGYELSEDYLKVEMKKRTPSLDEEIELQLAKELLHSNLQRLTKPQRDVIYFTMLRYSHGEIAKKMQISTSAVQKHLTAAKKKLSRIITGTKEIIKEGLEHGSEIVDYTDSES